MRIILAVLFSCAALQAQPSPATITSATLHLCVDEHGWKFWTPKEYDCPPKRIVGGVSTYKFSDGSWIEAPPDAMAVAQAANKKVNDLGDEVDAMRRIVEGLQADIKALKSDMALEWTTRVSDLLPYPPGSGTVHGDTIKWPGSIVIAGSAPDQPSPQLVFCDGPYIQNKAGKWKCFPITVDEQDLKDFLNSEDPQ